MTEKDYNKESVINSFNIDKKLKYNVGDKVTISGIYMSSDSTERLTPRINIGIITNINKNSRNPYLLNRGNIGWANDDVIVVNGYLSNINYRGASLVNALDKIRVDSSYSYRKKLAIINGINDYIGSAEQNNKLLSLLKVGKLIKA